VCGLREVRKAIKNGKAKAVLLAPNIEQVDAAGGLNDSVTDIMDACAGSEPAVPVVFALSRKRLGEVYGFRKRMSAIALLEVAAVQDVLGQVLAMAAEGRARWAAAEAAAGGGGGGADGGEGASSGSGGGGGGAGTSAAVALAAPGLQGAQLRTAASSGSNSSAAVGASGGSSDA
jgi:ribosomal protein L7Ae-like RNA K-turn-binding protein